MLEMLPPELASLFEIEKPRPLKRVEYDRLVSEGYFGDERVELLFGMVVPMSPIDRSHVRSSMVVFDALREQLRERARVEPGSPFAATDDSEPQPDVIVFPLELDSWHEHPDRAYLVVEVSRTSLRMDRGPKSLLYSISQVDEYWIVDHVHDCVEVYRDRQRRSWRTKTVHHRGETLTMLAFPDVAIAVSDILPPPA